MYFSDWNRELANSYSTYFLAKNILYKIFNSFDIKENDVNGDDKGVDFVVNNYINVDIKTRDWDICDDISIEMTSSPRRIGWTFDTKKETNYILYIYRNGFVFINFDFLRSFCIKYKDKIILLKDHKQRTNNLYTSRCKFLPFFYLQKLSNAELIDITKCQYIDEVLKNDKNILYFSGDYFYE